MFQVAVLQGVVPAPLLLLLLPIVLLIRVPIRAGPPDQGQVGLKLALLFAF